MFLCMEVRAMGKSVASERAEVMDVSRKVGHTLPLPSQGSFRWVF
jgi:hypothetical protein